jgi:hypothetical protein
VVRRHCVPTWHEVKIGDLWVSRRDDLALASPQQSRRTGDARRGDLGMSDEVVGSRARHQIQAKLTAVVAGAAEMDMASSKAVPAATALLEMVRTPVSCHVRCNAR